MDIPYFISIEPEMSEDDHEAIYDGLMEYSERFAPDRCYELLAVALRDESGALCGGLLGSTRWEWLQVEILWVHESLRGGGFGSRLLKAAEDHAISLGCRSARLDTFDFEAREFYEKAGYRVYGQLENFPAGHTQYHLTKSLGA